MFGNGTVGEAPTGHAFIMKTEIFTPSEDVLASALASANASTATNGIHKSGWNFYYTSPNSTKHVKENVKFYAINEAGTDRKTTNNITDLKKDTKYYATYDLALGDNSVIEISANSFPGTYYVTGDTFARNEASGADEFFQFIIPKAKVTSENTITLEAEGDPSVFNMNLTVLRPADGVMMKLVKYDLTTGTAATAGNSEWQHAQSLTDADSGHSHGGTAEA